MPEPSSSSQSYAYLGTDFRQCDELASQLSQRQAEPLQTMSGFCALHGCQNQPF